MRNALHALTDELRRLKSTGVKTVSVSDESIAALRRVIGRGVETGNRKPETGNVEKASPSLERKERVLADFGRPAEARVRPPAVVVPPVAVATLPPPPVVKLPEGDKSARWAALLAAATVDATCRANVRTGKKVVLGVGRSRRGSCSSVRRREQKKNVRGGHLSVPRVSCWPTGAQPWA
jgi:DNA polymerase